jgi:hypothetical protein
MRLCHVALLTIAFAAVVHAAPAPSRRPEPQRPPVNLTGWLTDLPLAVGAPSVIVRQTDYEAVAKAFGIAQPPAVDFRTHLLFVHVWMGSGEPRCEIDGGDLRCVGGAADTDVQRGDVEALGRRWGAHRYLIKSFPRSAVKTVNGVAVPGR